MLENCSPFLMTLTWRLNWDWSCRSSVYGTFKGATALYVRVKERSALLASPAKYRVLKMKSDTFENLVKKFRQNNPCIIWSFLTQFHEFFFPGKNLIFFTCFCGNFVLAKCVLLHNLTGKRIDQTLNPDLEWK